MTKTGEQLMRLILILSILVCSFAEAKGTPTIRSGVPEEFPNRLYAKYLHYLADKMEMQLELTPMPFVRQLRSSETFLFY